MADLYDIQIGATLVGMVNIETLNGGQMEAPKVRYYPGGESVVLGDGSKRWVGFPSATMTWGFISQANRDALRAYCAGASATVYISIPVNDNQDEYVDFQATMFWPDEEERDASRRKEFVIEYKRLIEQ